MVTVIQKRPSALAGLGAGLSQGITQGLESYYQQKAETARAEQKQKNLMDSLRALGIEMPGAESPLQTAGNQQSALQSIMNQQGPEQVTSSAAPRPQLTPEQRDVALGLLAQENKPLVDVITRGQQARTAAEQQLALKNEDYINTALDKVATYADNQSRFDKLAQLSSSPTMPSRWATALFTNKEGELRPVFQAGLSEDAQEFQKLVADMINGAKDTFGARVTNFDLQAYLKRLPSLMNSAEGRQRIIRDLSLINQINITREQGALDEIEKAGPGKITYSTARSRAEKANKPKYEELRKQFLETPSTQTTFSSMPDATKEPKGSILTDEESGQKWINDGIKWVLQQ